MKTKLALITALSCGLSATGSAFTLDFIGLAGAVLPPNPLTINVPGYGDVTFEAAIGSALVVDNTHQNDNGSAGNSLSFDQGETARVTFTGLQPVDINFDYVGLSIGESFSVMPDLFNPQAYIVTLQGAGNGAGIASISWNQVPEPSTSLLGVAGVALLVLRRRR